MRETVISNIGEIDGAWLDAVLRRAGALQSGGVQRFSAGPLQSITAGLAVIQVEYAPGSTGTLPVHLLLKMCEGGPFGSSEVRFYTRDYVDLADAPIPRCFDAAYSTDTGRYHIFMENLSHSHHENWDVAPTREYGEAVAESLAVLHAHHWGAAGLRAYGTAVPGQAEIDRYLDHCLPGIEPMIAGAAGEIDPSWPEMIRAIVARHPRLLRERARDAEGFTVVHGDPNPGNILAPRAGSGRVYLIDRQPFDWSLTAWLGVADVAYVMVHWWDIPLRRRFEVPVLRRYHAVLRARGVTGYSWDQLMQDYRLCAVQSLYVAAARCINADDRAAMRWLWLQQLRKSMTALVDLKCAQLGTMESWAWQPASE